MYWSFFDKNLDFICQLFASNGNVKPWDNIKTEQYSLNNIHRINLLQIIDALPKTWKGIALNDKVNAKNLVIFDHHIARIL